MELEAGKIAELHHEIKKKRPVIHCITNAVTVNDCANILLAAGASPTMAHHPLDVEEITEGAAALVCNLGAIADFEAMEKADILVFTTPNYCMSVSAQMKAFLDYYYDLWMTHRPKEWMFKKKAVVFSTSAGAYPSGGLKLMETNLNGWGI